MSGLIRGVARTAVIAGTATAVSNRVSRRQAGRWAAQAEQQDQEQMAAARQAQQAQSQQAQSQQAQSQQAQSQQAQSPRAQSARAQSARAQSAGPVDGKIGQLRALADLKAQGVLTDEEFQQQKNAILGD